MKKKVLITGGSGYFGESLTKRLLSKGYDCSILDLNPPSSEIQKHVRFFKCDIRDSEKVHESCRNIDYIYHNVAQVPLAKDKELFDSVNNVGTFNILESAKKNSCSHFVYTSSSAIYGVPKYNPVKESDKPTPMESYGKAKLDGENKCLEYRNEFKVSVIRPRTILGHGRLGIFQILFEWIYNNQNIPVFDKGKNIYQFIHSDDLADACIRTTELSKSGIFNIGTDRYSSMKDMLQFLIDTSGKSSRIKSLPSKFVVPIMSLASRLGLSPLGPYHALMYGSSMYFDISKAKEELQWKPKYSNDEMIKESYNWYLENRSEVLAPKDKNSAHKSALKQRILWLVGKVL
tara:strand:- start:1755 stop:2792 length:1038 start_codon:yes stop_codon:yes gene_type:complete